MCGIGGFSLSSKSKVNPRSLSNALLTELDIRGDQASGFAYQSQDSIGYFKNDVAGSRLSLKTMPKSASTVILHTRFATHGSTRDMSNNHPIQSPDNSIHLVHNGVIYNHDLVRKQLDYKLPEVDTSVIPALLQQYNRDPDKFSMLDGDAAIAWLDESQRGKLHLARISHSPLTIAQLKDGSFVFASTRSILLNALKRLGLKADFLQDVAERKMLEVVSGRINSMLDLPDTDPAYIDKSWASSYSSYRNMTSGGHGSETLYSYNPKKIESLYGDVIVINNLEEEEFPPIEGLTVNQYGEYFDHRNYFVGDINDMLEWGFIQLDGSTIPWGTPKVYEDLFVS